MVTHSDLLSSPLRSKTLHLTLSVKKLKITNLWWMLALRKTLSRTSRCSNSSPIFSYLTALRTKFRVRNSCPRTQDALRTLLLSTWAIMKSESWPISLSPDCCALTWMITKFLPVTNSRVTTTKWNSWTWRETELRTSNGATTCPALKSYPSLSVQLHLSRVCTIYPA